MRYFGFKNLAIITYRCYSDRRYYYCQKYWLTFATGILYLVCACFYALLFYAILRFQKFGNYNVPMLFRSEILLLSEILADLCYGHPLPGMRLLLRFTLLCDTSVSKIWQL